MKGLSGRAAVVTGSASGIGRAITLNLASRGVNVIATDIDLVRLAEVEDAARDLAGSVVALTCDVTDHDDIVAARATALGRFGRVDILVNNVGYLAIGLPEDMPFDAWTRTFEVNLLAVVKSIEIFLPSFLEAGDGYIVNTASTAGLVPYGYDRMPYAASKAAVISLSENLGLYLKSKGIGVSVFCPGPVSTNISEGIRFYGDHRDVTSPPLPQVSAEYAGNCVVDAIENDQFLVTSSEGTLALIADRGDSIEGYLNRQIVAAGES